MTENESEMVAALGLVASPAIAAALSSGDGPFGVDLAGQAARLAVTAWAMAVNGDDSTLAAIAVADAAHWLLHPVRKDWVVAAGPVVTEIQIWKLEAAADPPVLGVQWRFSGRKSSGGVVSGGVVSDGPELSFVGLLDLAFTGAGRWPWSLTSGHVSTLDDFLGWTFDSRVETAEEYRQRTGTSAGTGVLVPTDRYLLDAGFFEHDVRFGSSARAEVTSDTAPTRSEAERLIWPAIRAEVTRALGEGDWRPSLASLHVVRLLGPVETPKGILKRSRSFYALIGVVIYIRNISFVIMAVSWDVGCDLASRERAWHQEHPTPGQRWTLQGENPG